ncbi:MAG: glutamyl-tRNA reductase [Chlorobiota bacterium]|nr:glutamyl-tRNA reductase [Chlorobiota bacterium]QQS66474.1 MAG: glutamyl-tRNA reductase [Chlorobiota bacterium]
MNIYLFGINHTSANLDIREKVALNSNAISSAYPDLLGTFASECVIVSTCNRTEIFIVPKEEPFNPKLIKDWLFSFKKTILPENYFFYKQGRDASQHLYEVTSGIASQIIGDIQIIGQVRDSLLTAQSLGSTGKILSRLFTEALKTGKRVRTETDIFTGAVSVSFVAVELAKKIFYPLSDKSALVVGAGDVGELSVENLFAQGVKNISITNRTIEKAEELSNRISGSKVIPFDHFKSILHEFDIIIVSTGADDFVITYNDVMISSDLRGNREQLIVDISVPRNVEPSVSDIPNVYCKDINDLSNVIEKNIEKRKAELPKAKAIITEELVKFIAWCKMLPIIPFVEKIKLTSRNIFDDEFNKNKNRFTNENDYQTARKLTESILKKIIGIPLGELLEEEISRRNDEFGV